MLLFLVLSSSLVGQGFLHADGKRIANGNGENVILRGIGTGNWMIQEGYMMLSSDIAGTQHEFKEKLIQTIGEERTDLFYNSWLENHFRKVDVDSMAAWGFNSVRVALHYKWFTLPIEDEPVEGENTWLSKGFAMTDSLLSWCAENNMYLILDLHGAPGGQGENASISDYDKDKPSLWESEENQDKTVALWKKLASRYSNSIWMGGYDLINEVNWPLGSNNTALRNLYERITSAIREVDTNHIIFIEGNDFANNFNGLTPPWDENMVYSFHKYWTYNDENSLNWVLSLREQYDIPLWLGETGENSNTWFTNLVTLSEEKNIGWSWWPVKKAGINNILEVEANEEYRRMLDMWRGKGSMSADAAFRAVMTWSENHRLENCKIKYDVIDALIRQPHTTETKIFKPYTQNDRIFAVDFDLGRNNYAYFDTDSMNCHFSNKNDTIWNIGWGYRNDAVDIQECNDNEASNGYSTGWTKKGEWLQYTFQNSVEGAYLLKIRSAGETDGFLHIDINGRRASKSTRILATGSWFEWGDTYLNDVILPEGKVTLKVIFDSDGVNLNYFEFSDPKPVDDVPFEIIAATTHKFENTIFLNLNKEISSYPDSVSAEDFQLIVNHSLLMISEFIFPDDNKNLIILKTEKDLFYSDDIKVSYKGESIHSQNQELNTCSGFEVENNIHEHTEVPGKVEAESFFYNNGFQFENCLDTGGGQNSAYANDGDYMDYLLNVVKPGKYIIDFRVALNYQNAEILIMHSIDGKITPIKPVKFTGTGGWQNWSTKSTDITLPAGKIIFRIYSRNGQHNINWFSFNDATSIDRKIENQDIKIYPNPASDTLNFIMSSGIIKTVSIYDLTGKKIVTKTLHGDMWSLNINSYKSGTYIVQIEAEGKLESHKIQIIR